ncbi:MAG: diaminopimelate epimerase [Actinomycetia bacterium]|nr:diaminopimelate epimerase [Actinomycetes bacterium]
MGRARFRSENISPEAGGSSGAACGPSGGACGLSGGGAEDLAAPQRSGEEQSPPEQVALPAGDDVVDAVLEAGCWEYRFTFVDVGNPHCVIFVDDPATFDVAGVGRRIEKHRLFPHGVNVEFARVEPDGSVRMRVWERGVGETQACGTGAAAVGAACVRLGLVEGPVRVHLPGGDLTIEVVNDGSASGGGAVGGAGGDAGATTGGADAAEGATVGAVGGALPGDSAGRHDEAGAVSAAAGPAEGRAAAGTGAGPRVFMTGPAEEVFTCHLSVDMLKRLGWPATGLRSGGGGRAVL